MESYERKLVDRLVARLREPRRFMQVVAGPRQTGKTTAVRQALAKAGLPHRFARASQELGMAREWLRREWGEARLLAARSDGPVVLVVDEIQMVPQWSAVVKSLWDEDTDNGSGPLVVLTGSSALLLQKGLRESLAGRFELLRCQQWDFGEVRDAFGMGLDDYLFFGGYPGSLPLRGDPGRWLAYMNDAIVGPSILNDVIGLERIAKPALMRALFSLGAAYSAQEMSYRKIMGQLDDAGNTTTIAHYLDVLSDAGLLAGIQKYSGQTVRRRASSPQLAVYDTSLMTASYGPARDLLLADPDRRGHLVESAVGAYLLRRSASEGFEVNWWRDRDNREVDFVVTSGVSRTAIEVKSGRIRRLDGLDAFCAAYPGTRTMVVGSYETPLEDFLLGRVPLFD
ncbi:ATPase [Bifidobacterium rousetti]|uniref:ATP-binding protein n=1 Tax=Bifidobacterium rousetti TaxID=2045439 RepID=UPI00123982FC|nr:ATP-binding protein [Bifidobacterium rousetti]KAA8816080.1 ATPase [Bifidobacterium rousetti]